jgi:hypothetical protein
MKIFKSTAFVYVVAMLLFVVTGYFLSVGPVVMLAWKFGFAKEPYYTPLRTFYQPVFKIASSSKTTESLYYGYIGLWSRIVLNQDYPMP